MNSTRRKLNVDLKHDSLNVIKSRAREVLQAKANQISKMMQTFQAEDRTNRIETMRTLETNKAKVEFH